MQPMNTTSVSKDKTVIFRICGFIFGCLVLCLSCWSYFYVFWSQNHVFWTPRPKTMQNHYAITSKSQFWIEACKIGPKVGNRTCPGGRRRSAGRSPAVGAGRCRSPAVGRAVAGGRCRSPAVGAGRRRSPAVGGRADRTSYRHILWLVMDA